MHRAHASVDGTSPPFQTPRRNGRGVSAHGLPSREVVAGFEGRGGGGGSRGRQAVPCLGSEDALRQPGLLQPGASALQAAPLPATFHGGSLPAYRSGPWSQGPQNQTVSALLQAPTPPPSPQWAARGNGSLEPVCSGLPGGEAGQGAPSFSGGENPREPGVLGHSGAEARSSSPVLRGPAYPAGPGCTQTL